MAPLSPEVRSTRRSWRRAPQLHKTLPRWEPAWKDLARLGRHYCFVADTELTSPLLLLAELGTLGSWPSRVVLRTTSGSLERDQLEDNRGRRDALSLVARRRRISLSRSAAAVARHSAFASAIATSRFWRAAAIVDL